MTAAVGAALRIAAEQDVDVNAEQLRAVLRDTAQCLRRLQDDAAWRTVAVASGDHAAYRGGYVQASELIEQSAEEGIPPRSVPALSSVDARASDGHSIRDRLPGPEGLTGDETLSVGPDAARCTPGGDD